MQTKTQKITASALFAAIIFVATRFIQIPMPAVGYVNAGDGIVILAGWMLSPGYAFLAAGVGSAIADVLSPYAIYAPATFVIKGVMAILVALIFKVFKNKNTVVLSVAGSVLAELIMIGGYFLYEGILYGFKTAALSVPFNCVQGGVAIVIGIVLINVMSKTKLHKQ